MNGRIDLIIRHRRKTEGGSEFFASGVIKTGT